MARLGFQYVKTVHNSNTLYKSGGRSQQNTPINEDHTVATDLHWKCSEGTKYIKTQ